MDENVKAHLDSRINAMAPYLQSSTDSELTQQAEAVIAGLTELARQSPTADAFEQGLAQSPLNVEYGMVYSQLMTSGAGRPSMGQAFEVMTKGMAEHKGQLASDAAKALVSDAALTARLAAEDAVLDATREDHRAAEQAMREDPVLGTLETAGNLLGGLRGLFGRKR